MTCGAGAREEESDEVMPNSPLTKLITLLKSKKGPERLDASPRGEDPPEYAPLLYPGFHVLGDSGAYGVGAVGGAEGPPVTLPAVGGGAETAEPD